MPDLDRSPHRPTSLRATRRALLLLSTVVRFGLLAVGLGLVLDRAKALVSDVQFTYGERMVMGVAILAYAGGFALAGWVADRLLKAAADLIGLMVDQAEAVARTADLIEQQVAPTLGRIAVEMERWNAAPAHGGGAATDNGRAIAVAGVRQAIDDQRWDRAERLIKALRRDYPDAKEADDLAEEVAEGRQRAVDHLRARLDAAKTAGDLDQVLADRDELTLHLRGDDLKTLDREVVTWVMGLIQRRLRAGTVRSDVAELASKAAERFGDTAEGASLRAALPTLRRSAGLCPRCARPFTGAADACPDCLRETSPRPVAGRASSSPDETTNPEGSP